MLYQKCVRFKDQTVFGLHGFLAHMSEAHMSEAQVSFTDHTPSVVVRASFVRACVVWR